MADFRIVSALMERKEPPQGDHFVLGFLDLEVRGIRVNRLALLQARTGVFKISTSKIQDDSRGSKRPAIFSDLELEAEIVRAAMAMYRVMAPDSGSGGAHDDNSDASSRDAAHKLCEEQMNAARKTASPTGAGPIPTRECAAALAVLDNLPDPSKTRSPATGQDGRANRIVQSLAASEHSKYYPGELHTRTWAAIINEVHA
ncbi:hypothetical protein IVB45_18095 [Bradyrhizobium sp. 4]|uniref:hypothetical protein n=1 Tax=unclassified Bradyrhizobium TaxID=2631580 RepID=UPI001FFA8F2B|nr:MULTISPECIES: hypothetical protein [unclassified Bradyrhizobium]MCK1400032.1 hypothetical protein [Bradyrhizobium sp. 39]MCK1750322.1 hypothetical protein [Bradyrhizobium sp. 135]UPJ31936.1 hypothetical protein IVB45_18095 [Bradyrhizobium sp. 4]